MLELVLSIIALVTSSAIASGTEAALFAVPYGQVLSSVNEGRKGATALQRIKDDITRPIIAIVIINNISNILGSILVGHLAAAQFGSDILGLFSALLTFVVIVFAEIIPKTIGERFSHQIALTMSPPLMVFSKLLLPVIWLIEILSKPFARKDGGVSTSEAEITALTRLGQRTGAIEDDESELIQRVFRLNDITAWEIMTPSSRVDALDGQLRLGEIRHMLHKLTHTRLPVYRDNLNNVTGVVHLRDMLRALAEDQDHMTVQSLAKDPAFIPESAVGDSLLRHFQRSKQHLAIVVDALGNVLGVLTLEDVLEELVGEIVDETDVEHEAIRRVSKSEIVVDAATEMKDINRVFKADLPEGGRIGEQLIEQVGHIPTIGEVIQLGDIACTIDDATPKMLKRIRMVKA